MVRVALVLLVGLASLLVLPSCQGKARKMYPDPSPGRASAGYTQIFGRLQRVPSKNPENPPVWVIRYGFSDSDAYGGRLNLAPPEKLIGYSGGELVQINGRVVPEWTHPEFAGAWYDVQSIRAWSGVGYK